MNHHHKYILKGLSVNYKNWDHKLYIKLYNISKLHNLLSDLNAKILRYFAFTKSTISGTILGPSALQNFYANLIGSFMARYICQFVTLLLVVYHRASWKSLFLQFIRAQFAYQYGEKKDLQMKIMLQWCDGFRERVSEKRLCKDDLLQLPMQTLFENTLVRMNF